MIFTFNQVMEMTADEIANKVLSSNEGLNVFSDCWRNKELYDVPVAKAIAWLKDYICQRVGDYVNACSVFNDMDKTDLEIILDPELLG